MKIVHIKHDVFPPVNQTFQLARVTCPYCSKNIEYVLAEDDISYEEEAKYLQEKVEFLEDKLKEQGEILATALLFRGKI